jgi:hypothetical protein
MGNVSVITDDVGPPVGDAAAIERSWGDPELFAAIFDRYFSEVHRYLARRVGPAELTTSLPRYSWSRSPSGAGTT